MGSQRGSPAFPGCTITAEGERPPLRDVLPSTVFTEWHGDGKVRAQSARWSELSINPHRAPPKMSKESVSR